MTNTPTPLPTASAEDVGLSTERLARLASAMGSYTEAGTVPGILTAVMRRGQLVHLETFGSMDADKSQPLRDDAIFRLASMTKPIIGVLTMVLYEEGHFTPNDKIARYLPEFSDMKVRIPGENGGAAELAEARPITIKHLLTHTAGLPYYVSDDEVGMAMRREGLTGVHARLGEFNLEQYVQRLASYPLTAQPGTEWRYSEGMCVLGRLAEVVTGQTLSELLQQRVFQPLGMVDTGFYVPPDKAERLSHLYVPEVPIPNWPTSNGGDFREQPRLQTGSSGLAGTARDYLRLAQMLLNGGELDGVRLLSPVTVDLMMSNHLGPELGESPLNTLGAFSEDDSLTGKGVGFGFTGSVVTDPVPTCGAWSKGDFAWGGGFGTHFWIDRQHDLIGLIMTQAPANAGLAHVKMHHLVRQAIL